MEAGYPYLERSFLAVQKCAVPLSCEFSEEQRKESLRLLNDVLELHGSKARLKLIVFFICLDLYSVFTTGKVFAKSNTTTQSKLLSRMFNSSLPLVRKGFWGVNTLAKLGVYGQPSVYPRIGYRMKPLG